MIFYRDQRQQFQTADQGPADENKMGSHTGIRAAVAVANLDWNIIAANQTWQNKAATHGLKSYLGTGRNYKTFCSKFFLEKMILPRHLSGLRALEAGGVEQVRDSFELPDGSWAEMAVDLLKINDNRFVTLTLVDLQEIVSLRRQQLVLDESLEQAHALLLSVQDEERRSVARELHDSAGQYLTALSLVLTRMRRLQCTDEMTEMVADMSSLIDDFHQRIRGITYVLHPPELEQGGLCPALRSLCNGLARRTGLAIDLDIFGADDCTRDRPEATAYRLIQEALTNVLRHAHATQVRIRVCIRADSLLLVVRDNGVGLGQYRNSDDKRLEPGVGVAGMTARVCKLGGRLVIRDGRSRTGTFVAAVLPKFEDDPVCYGDRRAAMPRAMIDSLAVTD